MTDKQLARDVATELDRRRRRRRLVMLAAFAAAVIGAVLYGTCGHGWGFGKGAGKGGGSGSGIASAAAIDAGPRRCAIRITAAGIVLDGKPATRDQAVTACKATSGADVIVTGDARQGDWDDLRAALATAGVAVDTRQ